MNIKYALLALLVIGMASCKKDKINQPGTLPPFVPGADKSFIALKLKDINIRSLPSPYYHFDYSDDKHISSFNFSSGLMIYNMNYNDTKIASMKNTTFMGNRDNVEYLYTNDLVTGISVSNEAGTVYRKAFLTYNASNQLTKLEWEVNPNTTTFSKEQSFEFKYNPDGNVKEIKQHYFVVGPQTEATFIDTYENYDDKLNVEGFSLIHISQFRHPILLTNTVLQVNNAKRITRTGDGANFVVNYNFAYDANGRPLEKHGDFVYTNGTDNGKHFDLLTNYTYYN